MEQAWREYAHKDAARVESVQVRLKGQDPETIARLAEGVSMFVWEELGQPVQLTRLEIQLTSDKLTYSGSAMITRRDTGADELRE